MKKAVEQEPGRGERKNVNFERGADNNDSEGRPRRQIAAGVVRRQSSRHGKSAAVRKLKFGIVRAAFSDCHRALTAPTPIRIRARHQRSISWC